MARIIRTRFWRADFRHLIVKILVNPSGFTAFCALICQKSASQKICDPKVRIFDGFLDVEDADRLSPFKSETPKSRKKSRFWAGSDYTRHSTISPQPFAFCSAMNFSICSTFGIASEQLCAETSIDAEAVANSSASLSDLPLRRE